VVFLCTISSLCHNVLAQDKGGTKFRGLSVNQTLEQAANSLRANGFDLAREENSEGLKIRRGSESCGSVYFGRARSSNETVVTSFRLEQCYFGASGLSTPELAQAVIKNYRIPALDPEFGPGGFACQSVIYKGRANTGELIRVLEPCLERLRFGAAVFIDRVLKSQEPKFD